MQVDLPAWKNMKSQPFILLAVSGAWLKTPNSIFRFRLVKGDDGCQENVKFSSDTLNPPAWSDLHGLCTDWWLGFLELGGTSWTEGYKAVASK